MAYIRRSELTCAAADLPKYANTVLMPNEALYIKLATGRHAVKFGDGKTPIKNIPYSINYDEVAAEAAAATRAAEKAQKESDSIYMVQKAPPFAVLGTAVILPTPDLAQIEAEGAK